MKAWTSAEFPVAFRAGLRLVGQDVDALPELLAAIGSPVRSDRMLVSRARRALDDLEQSPSVSALAHTMDVHPVHLARLFRQAFGVSMREYRTIRLVKRAAQVIVSTKAPLSRIAHDCGFSDHSHMCRAFRHVVGWNPGLLRASSNGVL